MEGDALEHPFPRLVGEPHVLKLDLPPDVVQLHRGKLGDFLSKSDALKKAKQNQIFVFGIFRPMVYMLYVSSILCLFYLGGKGYLLSWSWDRDSMWVNRSCRRAERIFCPVFCRRMDWR